MSKHDELICIGCGATIQSDSKDKMGYVPASALENRNEDDLYCKRCFRLRHYNEVSDVELTSDDFLNMLNNINDQRALIVNIVDIIDFNGSVITGIERFAGNNPVMIVGNKVDLLPKSLKHNHIRQWLTERVHELGLRPVDISLISAVKRDSVRQLLDKIEKIRGNRDVYVVGTTNVGKSTLINQIVKLATDQRDLITTSYIPGTTLGKIEIPLDDGHVLVDTPGIFQSGQMAHVLSHKEMNIITPKKTIKPATYQLNEKQTLFLGGVARFDYKGGAGRQSFVVYASNALDIHRTKLEKADALYQTQKGKMFTPPLPENAEQLPDMKQYHFKLDGPTDIVFSGLGWVKVNASHVDVSGHAPKGVDVFVRKPMI